MVSDAGTKKNAYLGESFRNLNGSLGVVNWFDRYERLANETRRSRLNTIEFYPDPDTPTATIRERAIPSAWISGDTVEVRR